MSMFIINGVELFYNKFGQKATNLHGTFVLLEGTTFKKYESHVIPTQ
jgi:hypothetical protein